MCFQISEQRVFMSHRPPSPWAKNPETVGQHKAKLKNNIQ